MENENLVLQKVVGLVLNSDGDIQVRQATLPEIGLESDSLEVDGARTWVRFSRPNVEAIILQGGTVYPGSTLYIGRRRDILPAGPMLCREGEMVKIISGRSVAMLGMWPKLEAGIILVKV